MNKKTAVIIPVYNEGDNLSILIPDIYKHNKGLTLFVVDDNSTDKTGTIIKKMRAKYPIFYIKRKSKLGRGTAVIEGFRQAYLKGVFEIFVEMDADLSHKPEELKGLIGSVDNKTMVLASRYIPKSKILGISKGRKIISKIVNGFEKRLFGLPIHDYTNGFRAYSRDAVSVLIGHKYKSSGFATIAESTYLLHKKGFRLKEKPTIFINRRIGGSKADLHEMYISLRDLIRVRFSKI